MGRVLEEGAAGGYTAGRTLFYRPKSRRLVNTRANLILWYLISYPAEEL